MDNIRIYGKKPYKTVLVHGGPGAPGEMTPVAKMLKEDFGVLEPLQTKDSINGQIEELYEQLSPYDAPFVLVGYSWGAWLVWMFAARYPKIVSHIILVSSGVFDEKYVKNLMGDRLDRLSEAERAEANLILQNMSTRKMEPEEFSRFGWLMTKADSYCWDDDLEEDDLMCTPEVYEKVWPEAAQMRRNGELLKMAEKITCKITAIHGTYDPSPYQGVQDVLNEYGVDFEFILMDKCGHTPWKEKYCSENFFKLLKVLISENL